MSVLKANRKESKMEYVSKAYKIYIQSIEFSSHLSARYSRIMAQNISDTAFEVLKNTESANSIYLSSEERRVLREEYLLKARASLYTLDTLLSICYEILMQNPAGALQTKGGKTISSGEAKTKIEKKAQVLGELIDEENRLLTGVIKQDKETIKKQLKKNK